MTPAQWKTMREARAQRARHALLVRNIRVTDRNAVGLHRRLVQLEREYDALAAAANRIVTLLERGGR